MRTLRGARSTWPPRRAMRWSGSPSCFTELYIGGTWRISPTKPARAARTAGSAGSGPSWRLSTVPSASKVSVATPSSIEPAYTFGSLAT